MTHFFLLTNIKTSRVARLASVSTNIHQHKRLNGGVQIGLRKLRRAFRRSCFWKPIKRSLQQALATYLHVDACLVSLKISRRTGIFMLFIFSTKRFAFFVFLYILNKNTYVKPKPKQLWRPRLSSLFVKNSLTYSQACK